jgi:hypothetical protein
MAARMSQVPYYLAMFAYLALNAFIYFVLNQTVTGYLSDVYLVASFGCGLLAAAAFFYMVLEDDGEDTLDANVTIPYVNVTISKPLWYLGALAAMGVRGYFAYQSNHNATGAESVWGYVWLMGTAVLFLMTWPNAKAHFKARATAARNRAKAEAAAAVEHA